MHNALARSLARRQLEEDCTRRLYETVASGSLDALRDALADAEGMGLYYSEAADQARLAISVATRDFTTVKGATQALERALEHALLQHSLGGEAQRAPSSRWSQTRGPVCYSCRGREVDPRYLC
jgi:hypothetical protein